jgi:hypothetical protein
LEGDEVRKKDELASISEPLRDALLAYAGIEPNTAPRAVIAQRLLGPAGARILLPQLDEIARNVRPRVAAREQRPGHWDLYRLEHGGARVE